MIMRIFIWKLKNSLNLFISNQLFLISCKLTNLLTRMMLCNDFSAILVCINQIIYNDRKAYLIWLNLWNNTQHCVKACLIKFISAYLMTYLRILYVFICCRNFAWVKNSWSIKSDFLNNCSAIMKIYYCIFSILLRKVAELRLLI